MGGSMLVQGVRSHSQHFWSPVPDCLRLFRYFYSFYMVS